MILTPKPIGDTCVYCVRGIEHDHIDQATHELLVRASKVKPDCNYCGQYQPCKDHA